MSSQKTKLSSYLLLLVLSLLLGIMGGLITIGFVELLKIVHELVWTKIPNSIGISNKIYIIIVPTIAGIFVGWAHKNLGPYPQGLEKSFAKFKKTGQFDYKHIWQAAVVSIVVLGAGAALGPEAALITIIGGLGTIIAKKISTSKTAVKDVSFISMSAMMGAVFNAALIAPALQQNAEAKTKKPNNANRISNVVFGTIAATGAYLVMKYFGNGNGYFDYSFLPYTFNITDVIWASIAALFAVSASIIFVITSKFATQAVKPYRKHPIIIAVTAGLIFGVVATTSNLIMFSGHEGIQQIINSNNTHDFQSLMIAGLTKAFLASMLLAMLWKGGKFFPILFAGAAIGLASSHLISAIDPMVGLAAGTGAALAGVIPKISIVLLLLIFMFPLDLFIFAAIGTVIGALFSKRFLTTTN